MNKIKAFFISLILICVCFAITNMHLVKTIDEYSMAVVKMYGNEEKNTSSVIQNSLASKENVLMMYGSSELGTTKVRTNPMNFFPKNNAEFIACPIGRGSVQDLQHAMKFACNDNLKNKKCAFIVSLQWFMNDAGIGVESFQMNFSEREFYAFINNPKISKSVKKKMCKRVADLTRGNTDLRESNIYARLYSSDKMSYKLIYGLVNPYYKVKYNILKLKENIGVYKFVKKYPEKGRNIKLTSNEPFNKEKELQIAEETGKKLSTNNEYYIKDDYFNKYLRDNLNEIKGRYSNMKLVNSKEFEDLDLLLEVCREQNIKPLFILMPVNGKWYDYTGLSKSTRDQFFSKVKDTISQKGFEVVDFQQHEYDKYFMVDGMHLGWKGWIYVNEQIERYYNEK